MPNNASPDPNSIVQDDTDPLVATIEDANGPVNLAGCTVNFRMVSKVAGSGHAAINATAMILQDVDLNGRITNKGMVQYVWAAGETHIPGVYGVQFTVTFANGKTRTFPNDRQVTLEISPVAA